jgi:hypothetical protein
MSNRIGLPQIEQQISNILNLLRGLAAQITTINGTITQIPESDVTNLVSDLAALTADINGINTTLTGDQNAITSIGTEINAINTYILNLQDEITVLQTEVYIPPGTTIQQTNTSGVNNPEPLAVQVIVDIISGLSALWDAYKFTSTAFTALQAAYAAYTASNDAGYAALVEEEAANTTAISAADTTIGVHTTEIAANTTEIATNTTSIATLDAQYTAILGDISTLTANELEDSGNITILNTEVAALQVRATADEVELTTLTTLEAADSAAIVVVEGEITAIEGEIGLLFLALSILGVVSSSSPGGNTTTNVTNASNNYNSSVTNVTQQAGIGNSLASALAGTATSWGSISGTSFTLSTDATYDLAWMQSVLSLCTTAGLLSYNSSTHVYTITTIGTNISTYLNLLNTTMQNYGFFTGNWTETTGSFNVINAFVSSNNAFTAIQDVLDAAGLTTGTSLTYPATTLGNNLSTYMNTINSILQSYGIFSSSWTGHAAPLNLITAYVNQGGATTIIPNINCSTAFTAGGTASCTNDFGVGGNALVTGYVKIGTAGGAGVGYAPQVNSSGTIIKTGSYQPPAHGAGASYTISFLYTFSSTPLMWLTVDDDVANYASTFNVSTTQFTAIIGNATTATTSSVRWMAIGF